jgi:RES domain-containing protein
MSNPWPPEQELRARLAALLSAARPPGVVEWRGATYRFAALGFADRDRFTDGEGARRNGGRFTPLGGPRTVYLSLDRATATAELDSWFAYYNIPDSAFLPRVLAAVAVSASLCIDLCAANALADIGITAAHVIEEWRGSADKGNVAAVQMFGRLIYEAGFEGIRFPSARREGGVNLAIFPDNYREGSHAVMLNPN